MVGLFGFLPLLAPRALVMVLPWFAFTVQSGQIVWTTIGFQYAAIPVASLAIAAVFGFATLDRELLPAVARRWRRFRARRVRSPSVPPSGELPMRWGNRLPRQAVLAIVAVALIVGVDLYIGPLNPANQQLAGGLPGFNVRYTVPAGFANVVRLAALIPAQAPVLASSNLFPLVANDLRAYSLLWTANQPAQLPFGPGALPQFVFLASNQLYAAPTWLVDAITHHLLGLRGEVNVTAVGPVYLWEASYSGPPSVLG